MTKCWDADSQKRPDSTTMKNNVEKWLDLLFAKSDLKESPDAQIVNQFMLADSNPPPNNVREPRSKDQYTSKFISIIIRYK